MRRFLVPAALAFALLPLIASSCSNSGDGGLGVNQGDMSMSAPADMTKLPDLAKPLPDLSLPPIPDMTQVRGDAAGIACGMSTCAAGEQCCVSGDLMNLQAMCAKSCGDGGLFNLMCDGPEDCGGNPCCADIKLAGQGMMMPAQDIKCGADKNACVPALDLQARAAKTRLCQIAADCGGDLPDCCDLNAGGQKLRLCFSAQFAAFTMGLVTCQ